MVTETLYKQDFYSWAFDQADLLRQGGFDQLDLSHVIEELEDLGNQHYDQLESRLDEAMAEGWLEARDVAIAETDLPDEFFP